MKAVADIGGIRGLQGNISKKDGFTQALVGLKGDDNFIVTVDIKFLAVGGKINFKGCPAIFTKAVDGNDVVN